MAVMFFIICLQLLISSYANYVKSLVPVLSLEHNSTTGNITQATEDLKVLLLLVR